MIDCQMYLNSHDYHLVSRGIFPLWKKIPYQVAIHYQFYMVVTKRSIKILKTFLTKKQVIILKLYLRTNKKMVIVKNFKYN